MNPLPNGPPVLRLVVSDASRVAEPPDASADAGPPWSGLDPDAWTTPSVQDVRIAARSSGRKVVFLSVSDVWAFEARERLVFVHAPRGTFDVDIPLTEIQSSLGPQFLRVHRNWLVSLAKVRELVPVHGAMQLFAGSGVSGDGVERQGIDVPVSRDRMKRVRQLLLADTFGIRPPGQRRSFP